MNDLTDEQIAELRTKAEAATPGKRSADGMTVANEYGAGNVVRGHEWDGFDATVGDGHMEHDPAFLAATDPGTVLALLEALETARTEREEARALLEAAYEIIARQERTIEGHENVDAVGLRRRAEQAEAQVQAVRELHNADGFQWVGFPRADKREVYCTRCHDTAPCPTIRALDGAGES